jgi:hypothetical protein
LAPITGAIVGPITYLVVVRRRLGVEQFVALLALVALPGMVLAIVMSLMVGDGWPSVGLTAASAVAVPVAFWVGVRR